MQNESRILPLTMCRFSTRWQCDLCTEFTCLSRAYVNRSSKSKSSSFKSQLFTFEMYIPVRGQAYGPSVRWSLMYFGVHPKVGLCSLHQMIPHELVHAKSGPKFSHPDGPSYTFCPFQIKDLCLLCPTRGPVLKSTHCLCSLD